MLSLEILLPAFLACLVLAPILGYLGMHVLARGVIFIDIALAQLAALGAAVGAYFGSEPHTFASYVWSFAFAVVGSGLIALARGVSKRVPQEAFIGITYAVAAAVTVLVASALPHGDEEIKDALVGSLLTVGFGEVAVIAVVAAAIGGLHFVLRRRFLAMSFARQLPRTTGWKAGAWEFMLYISFGVVITGAVQVAGVLLVFSLLIVPAVFSALFSDRLAPRLAIAWVMGPVISFIGLVASYKMDLPTGAAIVVAFGAALVVGIGVAGFMPRRSEARAPAPALGASFAANDAELAARIRSP